jgi:hypothetical protein
MRGCEKLGSCRSGCEMLLAFLMRLGINGLLQERLGITGNLCRGGCERAERPLYERTDGFLTAYQ